MAVIDNNNNPEHDLPKVERHDDFAEKMNVAANTLPLEPSGSISRLGQDTYRRETGRDSVTGSFRTQEEAKGLSTTRTKK